MGDVGQGDHDGIFSGDRTPAPVRGRMRSISNRFLMLSLVAMLVCAAVIYAREVGAAWRPRSAARRAVLSVCAARRAQSYFAGLVRLYACAHSPRAALAPVAHRAASKGERLKERLLQEEEEESSIDDENLAWKLAPDHVHPQDALHAQRATRAAMITTNYNYEVVRHRSGAAERKRKMDPEQRKASAPLVLGATDKNSTWAAGSAGKQVDALERERALKTELAAKAKVWVWVWVWVWVCAGVLPSPPIFTQD